MRRRGFTLVELMIVVAIIGILAAIAIPNFIRYQLRAKTTEAVVNLQAISKAEEAYFAEFSTYVSVSPPVPATMPGSERAAWTGSGSNFDVLGWAPEGKVFFQYAINADSAGGSGGLVRYTAEAASDLDADGQHSFYGYVRPAPWQSVGLPGALPGTTCLGTGVYSGGGAGAVKTAGACDASSGKTEF